MSLRRSVGLAVLAMALTCRAAAAAAPELRARVTLSPTRASIGQLVTYRGSVVHPRGARVRWQAPENRESLTWGAPRSGVISSSAVRPGAAAGGVSTLDTAWIEVTLQAFELGEVRLAGLEFDYASGDAKEVRHERLPLLTLVVLPTVPADSTERLADVHAPIAAPWWERVPWGWIVGIVVVAVLAVLIWKRLARKLDP
ncbi:MAG: hypothetical protein HOP12_00280, partial [Candidatus Eisenbacteria bacterium]|nr:hypothetical protein [Candidatus Eisenbacteria bacterium]